MAVPGWNAEVLRLIYIATGLQYNVRCMHAFDTTLTLESGDWSLNISWRKVLQHYHSACTVTPVSALCSQACVHRHAC